MAEGETTAAKGSWLTRVDSGMEERACLWERGVSFWRELWTRAGLEGAGQIWWDEKSLLLMQRVR